MQSCCQSLSRWYADIPPRAKPGMRGLPGRRRSSSAGSMGEYVGEGAASGNEKGRQSPGTTILAYQRSVIWEYFKNNFIVRWTRLNWDDRDVRSPLVHPAPSPPLSSSLSPSSSTSLTLSPSSFYFAFRFPAPPRRRLRARLSSFLDIPFVIYGVLRSTRGPVRKWIQDLRPIKYPRTNICLFSELGPMFPGKLLDYQSSVGPASPWRRWCVPKAFANSLQNILRAFGNG